MKKITFGRANLQRALSFGGIYAGLNRTMPALDNIKITADASGGSVKIESTCLDTSASITTGAEIESDGPFSFLVSPKTLLQTIKTLSCEKVSLSIGNNVCVIEYPNGSSQVPAFDVNDYPADKIDGWEDALLVDAGTFSYIISSCKNFIGNDELRPVMKNIYIETLEDGSFRYCATDAHRLVFEKMSSAGTKVMKAGEKIFISRSCLPSLLSASADGGVVTISKIYGAVRFCFGEKTVSSSVTEGKYPNFDAILNGTASNTNMCKVNTEALKNTIVRAGICSSEQTHQIRITIGQTMKVEAEDIDFGRNAVGRIESSMHFGEDVTFGLNAVFTNELLDTIDSENVTVCVSAPNKAVTFIDENHSAKTLLLMPVMLNS